MRWIPLRAEEAEDLARMRQRCWDSTYRGIYPDAMIDNFDLAWHCRQDRRRMEDPGFRVCWIQTGGHRAGYLIFRLGKPLWLQSLYLLPEYRRRGLGRAALARLGAMGEFFCQCDPENHPALAFYREMGGVITARDLENPEPWQNSLTITFYPEASNVTDTHPQI